MKTIHIDTLNLKHYRNFNSLDLVFDKNIIILIGENGVGKTNILESISLLAPGRGLRRCRFDEICKTGEDSWHSNFKLKSKVGLAEIKTDFTLSENKRIIQYNGSKATGSELTNLLNLVWLTPQMAGLFLGGTTDRRRFLDRIVYNFDPLHASRINKYEHYMRERIKNLTYPDARVGSSWLDVIEEKMTSIAAEIHHKRQQVIDYMQASINELDSNFPKAGLSMSNLFDDNNMLKEFSANYQEQLKVSRRKDAESGRTNFGVNRTDFIVIYLENNNMARICSTGQQKAMLISIMIAQIDAIVAKTDNLPVLLLDELFTHLDDRRKDYLSEYIIKSKLQTFITATDIAGIEKLAEQAQIIKI